jgi:DNA invertase Pin-like site-specific DNA recombinase
VAQYLRMSTEHQRYSPEHQAVAIAAYSLEHGYELVRTYRDDGVSGLSMKGREGLKALLSDVLAGDAGFEVILVYDVSRWGRFQNPDQSAHYEFICAEAGVRIEYCAEAFDNDGSPSSTILKSLKRVMAAEYSRDLSAKVAAAQHRLAEKGFWQGGPAGYGFRRQTVDETGARGLVLERHQYKGVQGHRTVLVLGPQNESDVVRRIFHAFVEGGASRKAIARMLNAEGLFAENGRPWTAERIVTVLTNSKYMGAIASQKTVGRLGGPRRSVPKSAWVITDGACPPIVERKLFRAAQKQIEASHRRVPEDQLLALLRGLYDEHGKITQQILEETPWIPGTSVYRYRFGSLDAACIACGRPRPARRRRRMWADKAEPIRLLAALYQRTGFLSAELIAAQHDMPHPNTYREICGSLANAYAIVGFVPLGKTGQASEVGQARLSAAQIRLQAALRGRSEQFDKGE